MGQNHGTPEVSGDDEDDLQKAIVASMEGKRPREENGKAADDVNVIDLDDSSDDEDDRQKAIVASMEGKRHRDENGKAADDVNVIDLDDSSDDEDDRQKAIVASMEGKRPREENGKAADDFVAADDGFYFQRKKQNPERCRGRCAHGEEEAEKGRRGRR
jgi:hypothetical protein